MDSTKLCECGCGQPTPLGKWTDRRRGLVKGQPTRFIKGHTSQKKAVHIGTRYEQLPCACLCGELAPLHRSGWPQRWVRGHQNRKPLSFIVQDCGYATPCYVWRGSTLATGYPMFSRNGRVYMAHRQVVASFTEAVLPEGWEACHRCDNPPCIRPDHLFAGTMADNVRDMIEKGRDYRGERPWIYGPKPMSRGTLHPKSRLTEDAVRSIRLQYERGGVSERQLAGMHGVSRGSIRRVLKGTAWGWLEN